ncbi:MAG TPA: hypothetical protein PKL99_08600 [Syntrophales bacterium]|nr:hypothetical protein [Syntrophales bacterium]
MNRLLKKVFLPFAAILLLIPGCSSNDDSSAGSPSAAVEAYVQKITDDLTSRGFDVMRGYFKLYTQDDCSYSYEKMKSCFGNNPAAPYVLPIVPLWPDEFADPATHWVFGPTKDGHEATYRFDPREAVVIVGFLPPPAAYMGLQTYLFTREGTFDTESATYQFIANNFPGFLDFLFSKVPENPDRLLMLASLSNSNNNVVIERQSGSAFGRLRFFIITPDQVMDDAVRNSLTRISVDSEDVFTEPIPLTMRTGLDEHADDFVTVMRYAMPENDVDAASWRKDLPLVALRVRDARSDRAAVSYPPVVIDTRTANPEAGLEKDLTDLVVEINRTWGQPCSESDCSDRSFTFIDMQRPPVNLVGPACTEIGMNCLGDTQDTTYQATFNLGLDAGEIYAVAGTLGTETGNAVYVGLSVNESAMLEGIENIENGILKNTASRYAGTVNNTDKLYVYYLTRDCSDLDDLTDGNCFSVSEDVIPVSDFFKLIQRLYIHRGTQRGPDSRLTLPPRLIMLKRK